MFTSFLKQINSYSIQKLVFHSVYKPTISSSALLTTSVDCVDTEAKVAPLTITEACANRLKEIAAEGTFLRITIDGGGCSGFQYKFDLDSKLQEDDVCFQRDGAKIVVDQISLDFVKGSTVDYKEELIRSAFVISSNPQAESKCSCGTSFAVKMT